MSNPLIVWDQHTLSVGIDVIDNQHKRLVAYINELAQAINNQQTRPVIKQLFDKLYDYTCYHFQEEEAYFHQLNANDCELHKLQHKHFIEELDRIMSLKDLDKLAEDLLFFLTDWIVNHIIAEDRKFIQSNS